MTTHHAYELAQLRHQDLLEEAARARRAHAAGSTRPTLRRQVARVLTRTR